MQNMHNDVIDDEIDKLMPLLDVYCIDKRCLAVQAQDHVRKLLREAFERIKKQEIELTDVN